MGNALFDLSYGLFVLSVHCGKKDNACIINTAMQISSNPNTIAISVQKSNLTAEMLEYVEDFSLSTISKEANFALFERFGLCSGRDKNKFDGFDDCMRVKNGTLVVTNGTNSYISAHVVQKVDVSDHIIFIATVTDMASISDAESATYAYYHSNIKPKPEKKVTADGKTVWRCTVCGYEYEGEELPDDFVCPLCKHGKSDFEKIS